MAPLCHLIVIRVTLWKDQTPSFVTMVYGVKQSRHVEVNVIVTLGKLSQKVKALERSSNAFSS